MTNREEQIKSLNRYRTMVANVGQKIEDLEQQNKRLVAAIKVTSKLLSDLGHGGKFSPKIAAALKEARSTLREIQK